MVQPQEESEAEDGSSGDLKSDKPNPYSLDVFVHDTYVGGAPTGQSNLEVLKEFMQLIRNQPDRYQLSANGERMLDTTNGTLYVLDGEKWKVLARLSEDANKMRAYIEKRRAGLFNSIEEQKEFVRTLKERTPNFIRDTKLGILIRNIEQRVAQEQEELDSLP